MWTSTHNEPFLPHLSTFVHLEGKGGELSRMWTKVDKWGREGSIMCRRHKFDLTLPLPLYVPCVAPVYPLSCLFSSIIHSLSYLLLFFTFSFFLFLVHFTYFFFCPSLPFFTRIVTTPFPGWRS